MTGLPKGNVQLRMWKTPKLSGKMVKSDTINDRLQGTSLILERLFNISRPGIIFLLPISCCCTRCSHTAHWPVLTWRCVCTTLLSLWKIHLLDIHKEKHRRQSVLNDTYRVSCVGYFPKRSGFLKALSSRWQSRGLSVKVSLSAGNTRLPTL